MKYLVTAEVKTPWYVKLLRFLRLKKQMEVFYLETSESSFEKGDRLVVETIDTELLIIGKEE